MSYILEALKKSESERNQGRVPNLGQHMRMVHRKRKRGIPALVWLAIALTLNAVVLAVLFWPGVGLWWNQSQTTPPPARSTGRVAGASVPATDAGSEGRPPATSGEVARVEPLVPEPAEMTAATGKLESKGAVILDTVEDAPTVIVPTIRQSGPNATYTPEPWEGRVPHLVELPMSFQRKVPDLAFNSHVYSSRPGARSVMINNHYLRMGDFLGPLRVERITKEGVELSMDGQRFRVGVVRDWSSPR